MKKRLTEEDHRKIAVMLRRHREELLNLICGELTKVPKKSILQARARAAIEAIDLLRCVLDDDACAIGMDHHGLYYGENSLKGLEGKR